MTANNSATYPPSSETPKHTPQKCRPSTVPDDTPREVRPLAPAAANTTLIRYNIGLAMNGEILVCEVDIFINHYLPKVSNETLELVLKRLKKRRILVPRKDTGISATESAPGESTSGGTPASSPPQPYSHVFKKFNPPCTPENNGALEKDIFAPLTFFGEAICEALEREAGIKPNGYVIRMCGDNPLRSRINGCNHKIDACMTKNIDRPLRITDVAIAFEFKAKRANLKENRLQFISHINHAMNDDARRTFALGITIEDDRVSLWYCSRSHSIKARSFSMVEHADLFVKIMISLFCATDDQLGFDPLVELTSDYNFIYTFPPSKDCPKAKHFRTKHSIFETRALSLAGRSTRIWQVELVDPTNNYLQVAGAEDMVLKDVSLDEDTPTEDDIQKKLFADIRKLRDDTKAPWREHPMIKGFTKEHKESLADMLEGDGEPWKYYFSRIIATAIGSKGLAVAPEVWRDNAIFPVSPLDTLEVDPFQTIRPTSGIQQGSDDVETAERPVLPVLPRKKRCFYVFGGVYTPLSNIPTMGEAMDILQQCLAVLRLIFCAGWVHRDISAGNILAWRDGRNKKWQVKLSDLEYAKRFPNNDHSTSAVPKTGTPYFMAVEIQRSKLLLPAVIAKNVSAEDSEEEEEEEEVEENRIATVLHLNRPVKHNYQHDLESIWWMFLWLGSARVKRSLSRSFAKGLFQAGAATGVTTQNRVKGRLVTLANSLNLDDEFLQSLPDEMKPSFISGLETLRCALHTAYIQRNVEGRQNDLETYSYIMSKAFHRFFRKIEKSRDKWEAIELKVGQDVGCEAGVEGQEHGEGDSSKKRKTMDEEEQEAEETELQVGVVKKLTFASDTEKDDEENGTNEAIKLKDGRKKDSITLSPEEGNAGDGTKNSGKAGATAREHVATPAQTQRAAGPTTRSMTQAGGKGKEKPTAKAHGGTKKGNGDGPKPSKRARR
ncbi:other/FunK1 protein kinase [Coprinopsis cinerea AmutBmut pab1-1]|nr:other/FunK1 protein kinase [Coprinopsis cinerea AmutBmut pab1-1]